jgi:vitamin K-dependent gamma-carboxylase
MPAPSVDATWLTWARAGVGLAVLWQTTQLLYSGAWLHEYVTPELRVPLWPLDPLLLHGQDDLAALFVGIAALSLLFAAGVAHRPVGLALGALLVVQHAQDGSLYLNHHYLITLLVFVLAAAPKAGPDGAPAWALGLLRFHVVVPYVFAGLAKLDPDWLAGRPLDLWMPRRAADPWVGAAATWAATPLLMAWCSLLLDLFAPLALRLPRARAAAWAVLLLFHTLNSRLFNIGVFPWMMLWITPVLLPPDTLRRMASDARRPALLAAAGAGAAIGGLWPSSFAWMHVLVEAWGCFVLAWLLTAAQEPERPTWTRPPALVIAWCALHLLVPLRHLAIPGDVAWTEEGHRYSWRMLLRDKDVTEAALEVTDPATGERWYLRGDQLVAPHQVTDTFGRPDLLLAAARSVAERYAAAGRPGLQVRARSRVSLNGRPPALLVDPDVDLAAISPHDWPPAPWIRPSPRDVE